MPHASGVADHAPRVRTLTAVRKEDIMHGLKSISSLARLPLHIFIVVGLLIVAGLTPSGTSAAGVRLVQVATNLKQPLFVTGAGTDNTRLFVVEKPGRIRVVKQGKLLATPFLNITRVVNDAANERGLLGLAFHPDYESNGQFFVHFNDTSGDIVIARYTVSSNPDRADPTTATVILTIPHREASNHNGGMLAFGPHDRYLYIAVGDGGAGQSANAQDTTSCSARSCASMSTAPQVIATTRFPRTIRLLTAPVGFRRSGLMACETRSASLSTARPATSSLAMLARMLGRRSTLARRAKVGSILVGTSWKDVTASTRRRIATRLG
jgi:hypothetical protein